MLYFISIPYKYTIEYVLLPNPLAFFLFISKYVGKGAVSGTVVSVY